MIDKYLFVIIFFLLTLFIMYIQHLKDEKSILEKEIKNQQIKAEQKINNIKIKNFEEEIQNAKRKIKENFEDNKSTIQPRKDYSLSHGEHNITF